MEDRMGKVKATRKNEKGQHVEKFSIPSSFKISFSSPRPVSPPPHPPRIFLHLPKRDTRRGRKIYMYDSQWPANVRPSSSAKYSYCLLRPGWTYAPNRLTTKRWYKRLDTVQQGCMGNPGLCVEKGIKECEGTPSCSAISWWKGAMGRKAGDAGSIFLVKGITMANIDTTSRRHKHAMTMVKNS